MISLATLYAQARGRCCYCDGATWLRGGPETKAQARSRLGITPSLPGAGRQLRAATATREHLIRRADGGGHHGNIKLACQACNTYRGETAPDQHRTAMQALVAAGLHPTNRPPGATQPGHHRAGLKALREIRANPRPPQGLPGP